jgi:hypothetical protein
MDRKISNLVWTGKGLVWIGRYLGIVSKELVWSGWEEVWFGLNRKKAGLILMEESWFRLQ